MEKLGREKKWHVRSVITDADFFAKQVPSLNIKGETDVKTFSGGVLTAVIMTIILFYALDNFISLVEKDNPIIQEVEIPNYFSLSYKKNLTKLGSKIAFTLEDYYTS